MTAPCRIIPKVRPSNNGRLYFYFYLLFPQRLGCSYRPHPCFHLANFDYDWLHPFKFGHDGVVYSVCPSRGFESRFPFRLPLYCLATNGVSWACMCLELSLVYPIVRGADMLNSALRTVAMEGCSG